MAWGMFLRWTTLQGTFQENFPCLGLLELALEWEHLGQGDSLNVFHGQLGSWTWKKVVAILGKKHRFSTKTWRLQNPPQKDNNATILINFSSTFHDKFCEKDVIDWKLGRCSHCKAKKARTEKAQGVLFWKLSDGLGGGVFLFRPCWVLWFWKLSISLLVSCVNGESYIPSWGIIKIGSESSYIYVYILSISSWRCFFSSIVLLDLLKVCILSICLLFLVDFFRAGTALLWLFWCPSAA